jgi:hypothetical protein
MKNPLFAAKDSTQASGAYVTFEPGARSAWHTHDASGSRPSCSLVPEIYLPIPK